MLDKITKRTVDKTKPGPKRVYVWDTDLEGFGLVVYPNGKKAFVVRYRTRSGQRRRKTVGRYGALDVKKARNLLELALTFARSGNYDKGERYVRKARNVAETLLSLPFNRS